MAPKELGLSLRFIRQYDAALDRAQPSMWEVAWNLAMTDERDVPFPQKMRDAFAFIKSRIH